MESHPPVDRSNDTEPVAAADAPIPPQPAAANDVIAHAANASADVPPVVGGASAAAPVADETIPREANNILIELFNMDIEESQNHYPDVDEPVPDVHSLSWEEIRAQRMASDAADAAADYIEQPPNVSQPEPVQFDTELPSEHLYLGSLDRVAGVALLEARRTYRLPLLAHPQIVFPGEQVPMILSEQHFGQIGVQNGDQCEGFVFGLFFPQRKNDRHTYDRYYGVTCQVYEMGVAEPGLVRLKTRAQQRFEIVRKLNENCSDFDAVHGRESQRLCLNVTILPEQNLPDALFGYERNSWSQFRLSAAMSAQLRSGCASSLPWPRFVYDQYDVQSLMNKVKGFLSENDIQTAQMDPVALSFWCAKNVMLRDNHRWEIFQTNSVIKRMLIISQSLGYKRYFVCCDCYAQIAHFKSLFAMSKQGIQTNFCNPSGYIHETNTVFKTVENSVYLQGMPCTQFSWFPGYAWQIAVCKQCNGHLGWKFTVAPGSRNLVPKKFYGLAGARILIRRYVRASDARTDDDADEEGSENEYIDTEGSNEDAGGSEGEPVDMEAGTADETDSDEDERFLAALIR